MSDEDGVRFTVKELLNTMNDKLDRIEQSLQSKADKALVDLLAQKIESVSTRIPSELIKEHAQLMMQDQLNKIRVDWVDKRFIDFDKVKEQVDINGITLHDLDSVQQDQEASVAQSRATKHWIMGLILANIGTVSYSIYSVIHGFAH